MVCTIDDRRKIKIFFGLSALENLHPSKAKAPLPPKWQNSRPEEIIDLFCFMGDTQPDWKILD